MKLKRQPTEGCSVLDESVRVNGEVEFQGALRIDGTLLGSVTTTGELTVGPQARIKASVRAGRVKIFGTVTGDVTGEERVEISEGGVLVGDVRSPRLLIEVGGRFEGTSHRVAGSSVLQPTRQH